MLRTVPILIASSLAVSACESAQAGSQAGASMRAPEEPLIEEQTSEDSANPEPDPVGGAEDPDRSALALTLLATLAGDEPRATLRDEDAGTIASYRLGESVREGVTVVAIDADGITLDENGRATRVGFGARGARLSPDDVFYPDLSRFDDLPHSMADAVQLDDGPGYVVKAPAYAWGTPRSIAALKDAMRRYAKAWPEAPLVYVGDLSKEGGGPFPPHVSHQSGRDVDLGLVHQGRHSGARRFVRASAANFDPERTWALLEALFATGEVAYVFLDYEVQGLLFEWATQRGINPAVLDERLQYPRGRSAAHGQIRHWRGHDDHLHVRFRR